MSAVREMMNPVQQVQSEIAGLLNAEPWFKAHRVEVVEQNRQELAFRLKTKLSQVNHVLLVVGVDRITNNHTALEMEVTVSCTEHVMTNRAKQGFATAMDACQAAIQVIDGQWWHFFSMEHTTEEGRDVLQATATFRGLVNRAFLLNETYPTEKAETPKGA